MSGPAPKPAHLRQRTNKKAGATVLALVPGQASRVPKIPNPDGRTWHPLTLVQWEHAWTSPMASQWLKTDFDGLGRLARLWDDYNNTGSIDYIKEIRLQSAAFGLTPLDRSRLSWEVARGSEAEDKQRRRSEGRARSIVDPRAALTAVK